MSNSVQGNSLQSVCPSASRVRRGWSRGWSERSQSKGAFQGGQDCSLGFLGSSGGWSGSTGAPQPPCTHAHTRTHTHAHPGFQRSPISVNIPTVVETERPTWRQSSAAPLRGRRLAGSGRPGLAPAPEAWACAEGAHLPPSQRGQEGPGGVFSGEAAWPRLSPTPPAALRSLCVRPRCL